MIYFLLLILGWWNYNESEFPSIFKNSWDRPLYAICYSQNCPHCKGIPSRFHSFSKTLANNDEIIYTAIDTGNSTACYKLGARYVPYFVFARGTNPKYWLHPQFTCPFRWRDFVADWGGPKIIEFSGAKRAVEEHAKTTLNGGSLFFLQANKQDPIYQIYTDLSTKYHIFNDTFLFSSKATGKPKLTIYTSTNCSQSYYVNSTNIVKYIKKFRFSSLHYFDKPEFLKMTKSANSVLWMNDGQLNGTRLQLFDEIANRKCGKAQFGWSHLNINKDISKLLQTDLDSPYIATVTKKNQCQFIHSLKSEDVVIEDFDKINKFIDESLKDSENNDCVQFTNEKKHVLNQSHQQVTTSIPKENSDKTFPMFYLFGGTALVTVGIIGYCMFKKKDDGLVDDKIE